MTEIVDRRKQKTRAALHGAFVKLLLDQGYEAITIGAVTESADVGRSTFYEHYRTKDDLLRATVDTPFVTLANLVNAKACPASLANVLLVEAWVIGRPAFGIDAASDALMSATSALLKSLHR